MGTWRDMMGMGGKRERMIDLDSIAHSQIYLPKLKRQNVEEHIFHNPDADSPVAAVSCKMHEGFFQLELYSHAGRSDDTRACMIQVGMDCYQHGAGVLKLSQGAFPQDAPIEKVSTRLIGFEEEVSLNEKNKWFGTENPPQAELGKYFNQFENTDILSADPALRTAIVRRIYQEMPTLKAAVERANPTAHHRGS